MHLTKDVSIYPRRQITPGGGAFMHIPSSAADRKRVLKKLQEMLASKKHGSEKERILNESWTSHIARLLAMPDEKFPERP